MTDDVTKYNLDKQEEKRTKYIEPKLHYLLYQQEKRKLRW